MDTLTHFTPHVVPSSDVAFTPVREGAAGAQRLARQVRPRGGQRRLAHHDHARPRAIHRRANQPQDARDGQCRGPALHPASRRPAGLPARDRRQDDRLRRFLRQPAVHHAGKSFRQSESASVPDGLRPSSEGEDLGDRARRRGRRRHEEPDAGGLRRQAGADDPVHDRGVGHELPAAHPAEISDAADVSTGGRWNKRQEDVAGLVEAEIADAAGR